MGVDTAPILLSSEVGQLQNYCNYLPYPQFGWERKFYLTLPCATAGYNFIQ
jgi:hypothetical protein